MQRRIVSITAFEGNKKELSFAESSHYTLDRLFYATKVYLALLPMKRKPQKREDGENIIHFWRHENNTETKIRTVKIFMRSKVDYFFIFSPLSVKMMLF